jgi:hypothetical protein
VTDPFDLLVLGDANPDLVMTGDVEPAFGQAERLVDEARLTVGGSGAIVATGAGLDEPAPAVVSISGVIARLAVTEPASSYDGFRWL